MNKDRAKLLLTGQYPVSLVNAYLRAVKLQFPNESQYWEKYVKNDEMLIQDMQLFAEAHPTLPNPSKDGLEAENA